MRTENDLRDALDRLADDPPDPDSVLAAVRQADTRRRPRLVLAVAGATCAAAVVVPVSLQLAKPGPEQAGPRQPVSTPTDRPTAKQLPLTTSARATPTTWQYLSSVRLPAGFRPLSSYLTSTRQRDVLTDLATNCELDTFRAGAFDATNPRLEPSTDTVAGRPVQSLLSYDGTSPSLKGRAKIAWKYATNAWVTVGCTPAGRGDAATRRLELEVANSMTFGTRPMPVPFALDRLPAGMSAQLAGSSAAPPLGRYDRFELQLTRKPELVEFDTGRLSTGPKMLITYSAGRLPGIFRIPADEIAEQRTIDGHQVTLTRTDTPMNEVRVQIRGQDFEVDVLVVERMFKDPHAELIRIAEDFRFAPDPAKPATWFDGRTAIP